jgi:predicted transcriptional regulator
MKVVTSAKPTRENFTIRMEPNLKRSLKIRAIQENRDSSDLIEDAVRLYLAQTPSPAV